MYKARTGSGQNVEGELEAPSESMAAATLREKGLFPLSIRQKATSFQAAGINRESVASRIFPPVPLSRRLQFWRQLHALIHSGVSSSESLRDLSESTPGHLGRVLKECATRTASGEPISDVMVEYPATFPAAEIALIRAGEHAGTLSESVQALADLTEREARIRREFIGQLVYPMMIFVAILVVPLIPVLVLGSGADALRIIQQRYVPGFVLASGTWLCLRVLTVFSPRARYVWDAFKITAPGIGKIVRKMAAGKAVSVLAASYRSGVGLATGVEMAAEASGNAVMASQMKSALPGIRRGEGLTASLSQAHALPARALQLLATGEKTGSVDEMMRKADEYFRDETQSALKIVSVTLGVVLLVVAGLIVGRMAIDVYSGAASHYTVE
ncbi:MAG: type II secretion system F family protein [Armatimonadetes bacterium]|nr:type II secretion system F family protein [Armatimonadota bacterium]